MIILPCDPKSIHPFKFLEPKRHIQVTMWGRIWGVLYTSWKLTNNSPENPAFNPFEKYARQIRSCNPQFSGWKFPKICELPPPLNLGNPYNGYINPYDWVDDHPLYMETMGNHHIFDFQGKDEFLSSKELPSEGQSPTPTSESMAALL